MDHRPFCTSTHGTAQCCLRAGHLDDLHSSWTQILLSDGRTVMERERWRDTSEVIRVPTDRGWLVMEDRS